MKKIALLLAIVLVFICLHNSPCFLKNITCGVSAFMTCVIVVQHYYLKAELV